MGLEADHLVEMLEAVVLQVARSDGEVHDLEIAVAGQLEAIFDSIRDNSNKIKESNFEESEYNISDLDDHEIENAINEYNKDQQD